MTKSISHFLQTIQISDFSSTPKYQQLADAVVEGIKNENLSKGDLLPPINELSAFLDISRDRI